MRLTRRELLDVVPYAIAVGLRLTLPLFFAVGWGYDFRAHFDHVEYIANRHALPPLSFNATAYHPPLFYCLVALLRMLGVATETLIAVPITLGVARLSLLFYALRRFLPADPLARAIAMTLAGVLPCALHLDGMLTNEALLGPLALLAMILLPVTLSATDRRWRLGAWLGLVLAAMLLTKISALIFVMVIGLGGLVLFVTTAGGLSCRLRWVLPLGLVLGLGLAGAVPHAVRSLAATGKPFPTAFDASPFFGALAAPSQKLPLWQRRPAAYVFGLGGTEILSKPYYPTGVDRFQVNLLATTFADYYNYGFASPPRGREAFRVANNRPLANRLVPLMAASIVAGGLIAVTTLVAWALCLRALFLRRDYGLSLVLLLPLLGVLGQLHFAIKYPLDQMGMVKGHYVQLVAAPWFAVFGLAVSWLWRRARVLFAVEILALFVVAFYTLASRRIFF